MGSISTSRVAAQEIVWGRDCRERLLNLSGDQVKQVIEGMTQIIAVVRQTEAEGAELLLRHCHELGTNRLMRDLTRSALVKGFSLALDDAQETVDQPIH